MDLEREFLPLSSAAFAAFIDEPLTLKHVNLSTLTKLESHFLQLPVILTGAMDVITELCTLIRSIDQSSQNESVLEELQNQHRQCITFSRTATHFQQRVQSTSRLIADTLLLRDQVVATEQSNNMLQLNKSAIFITRLSLLYLPPSFIGVSLAWLFLISTLLIELALTKSLSW